MKYLHYLKNIIYRLSIELDKTLKKRNENFHQLTGFTKNNRYPAIFSMCQRIRSEPSKILSYGCSTGEEVFTLQKYFSQSLIFGFDINSKSLEKAEKRNEFDNVSFHQSNLDNLKLHGPFDMIFAMSVLCRWEDTENMKDCSDIYPFSRYEEAIHELDSQLKTNGLLILYNSNFRFDDSSLSDKYIKRSFKEIDESGFVTKFDSNNKVLKEQFYPYCIFQKSDWGYQQ